MPPVHAALALLSRACAGHIGSRKIQTETVSPARLSGSLLPRRAMCERGNELPHLLDRLDQSQLVRCDARREGGAEARGKPRIEHHEHAAVAFAPDQPAEGLPQPQPRPPCRYRPRRRMLLPARRSRMVGVPHGTRSSTMSRRESPGTSTPSRTASVPSRQASRSARNMSRACRYPSDRHAGRRASALAWQAA